MCAILLGFGTILLNLNPESMINFVVYTSINTSHLIVRVRLELVRSHADEFPLRSSWKNLEINFPIDDVMLSGQSSFKFWGSLQHTSQLWWCLHVGMHSPFYAIFTGGCSSQTMQPQSYQSTKHIPLCCWSVEIKLEASSGFPHGVVPLMPVEWFTDGRVFLM